MRQTHRTQSSDQQSNKFLKVQEKQSLKTPLPPKKFPIRYKSQMRQLKNTLQIAGEMSLEVGSNNFPDGRPKSELSSIDQVLNNRNHQLKHLTIVDDYYNGYRHEYQ